ncbi:nucleoid-associated protein [Yersinia hibernica]|uniref:Nucleoid-associated protein n=1 Tax=Yersinia hibernica TaxID=2339259 RepID=A0ABX5QYE1_9GAMM|nr:nucleoid-associated protein [Yersinia hibernica]ELI8480577.1 nucleoid-associated protein [Yersinia enterocolitica]QAX78356.1 nucleoid-associated protein [Yersinia hibernica]HDY4889172.1 nucleoid-associated protein [Yersinia enterocolitica]
MSKISIKHVIVHELIKEAQKEFDHSKRYNLRDTELDKSNIIVQQLVDGVVELYGSRGNLAHHGVFKTEPTERGPVPDLFNAYYSVTPSSTVDFINLSKQIMKQMYHEAKSQIWSSGGYVVFTDYIYLNLRYLLVTMIKKKNGVTISENLNPEEMMHLELNYINQAARINFHLYYEHFNADEVKRNELNYLSFISKTNGQSASAYFIAALGCDKGIASAGATRKLPNEVRRFFKKHAELLPHADEFRNKIIKYLEKQFDSESPASLPDVEAIAFEQMSILDDDKRDELLKDMMHYLNSEGVGIPTDFIVNRASLDKLRKVIYKTPLYSFNFDKELLGDNADAKIYYNDETGNLSFNNLPEEAKTKIRSALKERKKIISNNEKDSE